MPLDAIPRHIGLAASDLEAITGLPEGYFQGKSNVIQFATMKSATTGAVVQQDRSSTVVSFKTPKH